MDGVFIYELMAILFSALIAFIMTPVVRVLAFKLKALDVPDNVRHFHLAVTPRLGGLAIIISFIANSLIFCELSNEIAGLLLGTAAIMVIGVLDDIFNLKPLVKLLGQIAAALIPVAFGIRINFLTLFSHTVNFGVFSIPVTVFWIVLLTNAINLIDGMDGLACGVSMISALSILFCSLILARHDIALLMGILVGSCLGFLPFNFNPARIFMGDTGALSLGYVFSVVSISGLYKFSTTITFIIPILIFAVPFGDTVTSVFRRLKRGQKIFEGDHEHFHHKLLAMGFSQRQAVIILYAISGVLGISAILFTMDYPIVAGCVLAFTALAAYVSLLIYRSDDATRMQ
ncbi:MAG: undecaprenyl/decaprenyl-phosphate alpha-N-acetylglucosaminyl 1-phosphate transferase, partial [Clostridia bacterium]|nr:undecaprenyl/decaprenyl-phosphate alpha-N-acetylglucosaminyl 1-phosphate transferase [Clostridia bacterium]